VAQARTLAAWLDMTRELYNAALQERRDAYRLGGHHIRLYDQQHALAGVREVRPEFGSVPNVVQRGALRRLDRAFAGFFRRCKAGQTPGYPRFKSQRRFRSILLDDLKGENAIVAGGKRVAVPLLGKVKFKQHRPVEGTPKAMRLTLDAGGRWYVTLACVDVPAKPLPATGREVGVDLGLTHFAATSDGDIFPNPRAAAVARLGIERAQRRVSRRVRGSKRRRDRMFTY
jgi:putative transposase